ncbi:hypothetical protein CU044_3450 [Streptomyces sp. L-9-10]|nr:hypothetical protein CU044_3450 [Streptomyces sp. L-9-10]
MHPPVIRRTRTRSHASRTPDPRAFSADFPCPEPGANTPRGRARCAP